jgi:hypothetical protein
MSAFGCKADIPLNPRECLQMIHLGRRTLLLEDGIESVRRPFLPSKKRPFSGSIPTDQAQLSS